MDDIDPKPRSETSARRVCGSEAEAGGGDVNNNTRTTKRETRRAETRAGRLYLTTAILEYGKVDRPPGEKGKMLRRHLPSSPPRLASFAFILLFALLSFSLAFIAAAFLAAAPGSIASLLSLIHI